MNGFERITKVIHGEWPDRVPVMLHNFMMAAREAGISMERFRKDPRAIAEAFIRAIETYGYDGLLLDVDTVTLASAVGVPMDLPHDEPARTSGPMLASLEEIQELAPARVSASARVQVWLEAASLLKEHFGDEVYIRGNCDQCPFTLASMVRGSEAWLLDLLDEEKRGHVHALLDYCADATIQFIRLMAATGVHMVSNGDSFAGPEIISPALYREFAEPYEIQVVSTAHALGLPYVLHICGNTAPILSDMIATGADALEIDYKTDPGAAHQLMADRVVFIGNLDPSGVLAMGSERIVEEKTRALLELFADTPRFILNAGCAIPSITPSGNLRAMIRTARTFTTSSSS